MAHELTVRQDGTVEMFSVKETPWHGLGQVVKAAPSIEEAIRLAGLDWKVGLKPLFTAAGGPAIEGSAFQGALVGERVEANATFREDTGQILGVVGTSYKPLQNAEAFKFFNPFIEAGQATLETAGSLRGGKRVWILAKLDREDSVIVNKADDRVAKYLLLSNSHDGTLAVKVGFTPVRVVCQNTLSMALNNNESRLLRVRHTGNVVETLNRVQEIVNTANAAFEATAEQYRLLASKQVNLKDLEKYVKIIFAQKQREEDPTLAKDRESRVLAKIIPLFERGRGNDLPGVAGTMWAAYNAVNEHLVWDRGEDQQKRIDSAWFGQGAQLNKKALETAIEMSKVG